MIHRLMCLLLLCSALSVRAQNLIPNPSFEDTICSLPGLPTPWLDPFYTPALDWFDPNAATPDFYTLDHDENYECGYLSLYDTDLQNNGEWQYPKEGTRSAGLWCGNNLNISRDLLEAKLLEPLEADSEYCFSMYVSLGDSRNLAVDRIGAFFSVDSVYDHDWAGGFDLPLGVTSPDGVFLTDTADWMLIEGVYTAQGGEQFIIIGNPYDDSQTDYLEVDGYGNGFDIAKYFFDDLSLIPCSTVSIAEEEAIEVLILSFESKRLTISARSELSWSLHDLSGRKVYQGITKSSTENIEVSSLTLGMYVFTWRYKDNSGSQKVLVTR